MTNDKRSVWVPLAKVAALNADVPAGRLAGPAGASMVVQLVTLEAAEVIDLCLTSPAPRPGSRHQARSRSASPSPRNSAGVDIFQLSNQEPDLRPR